MRDRLSMIFTLILFIIGVLGILYSIKGVV